MSNNTGYSTNNWRARLRALVRGIALLAALSMTSELRAQDETWDGGGTDNLWTTGANWGDDTAPAGSNGEHLLFTGTVRPTPQNDFAAGTTFDRLELNTTVDFTLSGNAITLTDAAVVIDNSAGNNTISIPLTLSGASQDINSDAGLLTLSGALNTVTFAFDLTGAGNITLTGALTGSGNLNKTGNGTVSLEGDASAHTGNIQITTGILQLGGMGADRIGNTSDVNVSNGATFDLNGTSETIGNLSGGPTSVMDLSSGGGVNGTLTVNQASPNSFSGQITGTGTGGGIVKDGAAALVFTNNTNNYTGTTTIREGALVVQAGGALGASALVFDDTGDGNATAEILAFNAADLSLANTVAFTTGGTVNTQAFNGTLAGNLSGSGTMIKDGTGTLTLLPTDSSAYAGLVQINQGVLQVGNFTSLGSTAAGVEFIANAGNTLQFGGDGVIIADALTFTVNGNVDVGTVGGVNTGTVTGATSGAGSLTKTGAGNLILNNDANAHTGGTIINAGTLTLSTANSAGNTGAQFIRFGGAGTTLNLNGAFTLANDIDVAQDGNIQTSGDVTTLNGLFTGAATVDRLGTGTLCLTGNSAAFTGVFDNNTGTVQFASSALGAATAAAGTFNNLAGATLIGTGTAGTLNNAGGTLSPGVGTVAGTMTVFDFNQTAGNFVANLNADGTRDQIIANNNVAVNGTLTLQGDLSNQGSYFGQTFNIVTADADGNNTGDITDGTFDTVTSNFTFLTPTVTTVNAGGNGPEFIQVAFNSFAVNLNTLAANPNQAAVAQAIQNIFTTGQASSEFGTIFNQFFVASPAEQQNFLQQLAGEVGTANMTAALQANSSFTALALSQLASSSFSADSGDGGNDDEDEQVSSAPTMAKFGMSTASGFGAMPGFGSSMLSGMPGGDDAVLEDRDSVWVLGTGFWGDIDPTAVNQGFEYDGSGFVLGYTFGDEDQDSWKWGIHGGFNESDIDTVGALDNSEVDSWNVGLHGAYFEDGDYVNVVTGYNKNEFDTTRFFNIGTFAATSRADFDADEFFAYAEIGHIYDLGDDDDDDEISAAPGRTTASGLMLGGMDAPHGKGAHKDHKRVEPAEEPVEEPEVEEEEEEMVEKYGGEGWHAAPQLALQYRSYEQDAYTSTGAGALDQTVGPVELDMFQTGLGARFFHTSRTDEGGWIVPEVMVRWAHEFGDIDRTIRANFVGTNEVFAINGIRPDRDSLQLRAGVAAYTARDWNFDLSYNGEFSDNIENHAGVAKATWFFD